METNDKLIKKILIRGSIKSLTGLHIGDRNLGMEIGGINAAVIRNPQDQLPYIPGSSLKGKLRSQLELLDGEFEKMTKSINHGPSKDRRKSRAAFLFGNAVNENGNDSSPQRPARVFVRDCFLDKTSIDPNKTDLFYTQSKTEVVIDRITSKAMPRSMERVPAGARFTMTFVVIVMKSEADQEKEILQNLFTALELLQDDYLGGHGSRGSGQISIKLEKIEERDAAFYLNPEPKKEGKFKNLKDIPQSLCSHE